MIRVAKKASVLYNVFHKTHLPIVMEAGGDAMSADPNLGDLKSCSGTKETR